MVFTDNTLVILKNGIIGIRKADHGVVKNRLIIERRQAYYANFMDVAKLSTMTER